MIRIAYSRKNTGFTLLEVLLVLIIMSIIFSLMSLNISAKPSPAKLAASHLQQLLEFAQEDAVLKGRITAWKLENTQYDFYRYQNQQWLKIENDPILHPYLLLPELDYQLSIDEFAVKETNNLQPQLILLPDGTLPTFSLIIHLKGTSEHYRLFNRQDKVIMETMVQKL